MVLSLHRSRLLPGLLSLGLLLVLPQATQAETWLRGSGSDVWIEEDGKYQPPKENHRGFTKVAATRRPVVYVDAPVERYDWGPRVVVRQPVVVYGSPWYGLRHYRRGYYGGHRYDRYRPYRRHHYRSHRGSYGSRHRYSSGHGYRSSHRGGHYRSGRSRLGAVRGVHGAVGGGRGRGRRH